MYEITPQQMCVLIRNKVIRDNSNDDVMSMREVLLGERDLELDEAKRLLSRYEGKTPLIDAMQELLEAKANDDDGV